MAFLYSFIHLLQPGILWPVLYPYKPMLMLSLLAGVVGMIRKPDYLRADAFKHPAFVYLMLFLFVQVLSVVDQGMSSTFKMFGTWSQFAIYMSIAVLLMNSTTALYRFSWGMVLGAMVVVFYGLYVAYYGLGRTVGGHAANAYGMYENHNDYTYAILMIIPFLYISRKMGLVKGLKSFVVLVFLVACVIGIFVSYSRSAILALVLQGILILFFTVEKSKRVIPLILVGCLSVAAIGYQWASRDKYSSSGYTSDDAKSSRIELWKAGFEMFKSHPLLGTGSRSFKEYARYYGELSYDQRHKNAHNTYVEILATSGFLGIFTFMMFAIKLSKGLHSIKPKEGGDPRLVALRVATLVSFYTILFRAFTNAKTYDWSFYLLCVIGVVCIALLAVERQEKTAQEGDGGKENDSEEGGSKNEQSTRACQVVGKGRMHTARGRARDVAPTNR
ncbi:MAG: O-antigen ligase family protein [Gammaproteobacteria bacterium]|nr:O-antigen ligase family protein [Gammaproteobacteria bacterium]